MNVNVPLRACGQTHFFDCAFQLLVPGVLDYRFFVNEGVKMTLERVELYSGTAIPATTP